MKPTNYTKMEESFPLKKKYFPKQLWLKSTTICPPIIVIFGAVFCLVYLLNNELLYSWHSIPYILILLIGMFWLKSIQRIAIKRLTEQDNSFLVCIAKIVEEKSNSFYILFSTGENRHNNYYLENTAKNTDLSKYIKSSLKVPVKIEGEPDIYLAKLPQHEVFKEYPDVLQKKIFPIFYINEKYVKLIKKKDIR